MVPTTTATFGPVAVSTRTAQYDDSPRTVAFAAPLQLTEEELVAALFRVAEVGLEADDLGDLAYVRECVADQIINAGLDEINESLVRLRNLPAGSEMCEFVPALRAAVREAFASALAIPQPRAPRRRVASRRELAGVAQ